MLGFRLIFVHLFHIVSFSFKGIWKLEHFMSRYEITNYGFVIVDNQSIKKPVYNCKKHIENLSLSPFGQNNTEVVN